MGAHPSAPAGAAGTTLDAHLSADPDRELGPSCVARFGPRLPFLLKVLSADQALSIQLHPSRAQAEAGFRLDPQNYVDDWPKPELLCALAPFEVLAGLRAPRDAAALLRALGVAQLAPLAAELGAATSPQALCRALATILDWPAASREDLVNAVVAACAALHAGPDAAICAAVVREAANHPGDPGLVAMLLMRHVLLAPGQAVFLPAGGLHTYLQGTGIEVLANSDNVIRAGLTGKHIDVPELLKLLDPAAAVPVLSPVPLAEGIGWFDTPAPEFRLYVAGLVGRAVTLPGAGPRIVLCTAGTAVLSAESGVAAELPRGESCFIAAADGVVRATGPAHLFIAAPGIELARS
jgi:mannose-6-phosphate isomerase